MLPWESEAVFFFTAAQIIKERHQLGNLKRKFNVNAYVYNLVFP